MAWTAALNIRNGSVLKDEWLGYSWRLTFTRILKHHTIPSAVFAVRVANDSGFHNRIAGKRPYGFLSSGGR